jgi:hypothetical protein
MTGWERINKKCCFGEKKKGEWEGSKKSKAL